MPPRVRVASCRPPGTAGSLALHVLLLFESQAEACSLSSVNVQFLKWIHLCIHHLKRKVREWRE